MPITLYVETHAKLRDKWFTLTAQGAALGHGRTGVPFKGLPSYKRNRLCSMLYSQVCMQTWRSVDNHQPLKNKESSPSCTAWIWDLRSELEGFTAVH